MVKLGYGAARNKLDPNGQGDRQGLPGWPGERDRWRFRSLHGRIASGAHITAHQTKLKELVDKQKRDYPSFVSNRLGALIDAAVPGYEGDVRVDWSPKSVEIAEAGKQTTAAN
jgi:hypothetical protein